MNGLVLVDKPSGVTSHDVVNRWRRLANTKRVGHLGTLDPSATGLLALLTEKATRLAQFFGEEDKTYLAEITLGVESETYDAAGVVKSTGVAPPQEGVILAALDAFRGHFLQTPPAVSAKKINGQPSYKLARKGVMVALNPVLVEVKQLEVCSAQGRMLEISVICSAGTYIRSIAHDLGQKLGCGAILSRLRRTQIGPYRVEQAHTVDELTALAASGTLEGAVIPAGSLLESMPAHYVAMLEEAQIRQGKNFKTSPFTVPAAAPFVRALSRSGELIAIGQLKIPNLYHPFIVL